jgi:hypothetical protein
MVFDFLPKFLRAPATILPVCASLVAGGWYAGSKFQTLESRLTRIEEKLDFAKTCERQINDINARLAVVESREK